MAEENKKLLETKASLLDKELNMNKSEAVRHKKKKGSINVQEKITEVEESIAELETLVVEYNTKAQSKGRVVSQESTT